VTSSVDDRNGASTTSARALLINTTHTTNGEQQKSIKLLSELDKSVSRSSRIRFNEELGSLTILL
jgi:hypothetical protein